MSRTLHHLWRDQYTVFQTISASCDRVYCRMTNHELLCWLVETPSRDVRHNRMSSERHATVKNVIANRATFKNVTVQCSCTRLCCEVGPRNRLLVICRNGRTNIIILFHYYRPHWWGRYCDRHRPSIRHFVSTLSSTSIEGNFFFSFYCCWSYDKTDGTQLFVLH